MRSDGSRNCPWRRHGGSLFLGPFDPFQPELELRAGERQNAFFEACPPDRASAHVSQSYLLYDPILVGVLRRLIVKVIQMVLRECRNHEGDVGAVLAPLLDDILNDDRQILF